MKRLILALIVLIPTAIVLFPATAEDSLMTLDVSCAKNEAGVSVCTVPEAQLDKLIGYANTATKVLHELKERCNGGKWA